MEQVNNNQAPPTVMTPQPRVRGKKKLPEERRRVILSVRVLPSTKTYLKEMGYPTEGRALDILVKSIQHRGILDMMKAGSEFAVASLGS